MIFYLIIVEFACSSSEQWEADQRRSQSRSEKTEQTVWKAAVIVQTDKRWHLHVRLFWSSCWDSNLSDERTNREGRITARFLRSVPDAVQEGTVLLSQRSMAWQQIFQGDFSAKGLRILYASTSVHYFATHATTETRKIKGFDHHCIQCHCYPIIFVLCSSLIQQKTIT